ncbi:MAG: acyl-ACP--UDP-N-acetylglucosamine O-acyltransferase [Deltaproteobacteria bacterium]|nr:acyl-ACP--UDP-N-acetylglucosamine O-acyltransferase [Deltaproteobacteria bacterium]
MTEIHSTAIIHPKAQLGENVQIGPYSTVGPNVKIGDAAVIHSHVVVEGWTEIGASVQIFPFASVGPAPQDLKYQGEKTVLRIGDGTVIRESATLHPGTTGGGSITVVGSNCLIMVGVHIAHDCILGNNIIMANGTHLGGHVTIDDGAILGALCGIHQFVRIGALAMTGAGSMLAQDLAPYCMAQGDHASLVGLNLIGLRRNGMTTKQISNIKKAYHILFRSKQLFKDRLAQLERELSGASEIDRMIKFARGDSKRGLLN